MSIATNLQQIKQRVKALSEELGFPQAKLIAITKGKDLSQIAELVAAGQQVFGENRIQEAKAKYQSLELKVAELHLVGQLQRNKVKDALGGLFSAIHSLDRASLAHRLADFRTRGFEVPELFVQVNIAAEPQKGGVLPQDTEELVKLARDQLKLPVVGLMAIPPSGETHHFTTLKQMQLKLKLPFLSMGMSNDFEPAIKAGASHIRVGRRLFE